MYSRLFRRRLWLRPVHVRCLRCIIPLADSRYSACPPNHYASSYGASTCRAFFSNIWFSHAVLVTASCAQGQYQPNSGQFSCKLCPAGKAPGAQACSDCPPVRFLSAMRSSSFLLAAQGSYARFNGSAVCTQCDKGFYQPESKHRGACCAVSSFGFAAQRVASLARLDALSRRWAKRPAPCAVSPVCL